VCLPRIVETEGKQELFFVKMGRKCQCDSCCEEVRERFQNGPLFFLLFFLDVQIGALQNGVSGCVAASAGLRLQKVALTAGSVVR